MCTIEKLENLYIKEFVEYHKKLGVNKIFLYDNNDINCERIEDVLQYYININYVSLFNLRGNKKAPLFKAYSDCYRRAEEYYSWVIYLDVDEFVFLKNENHINNFLNNKRYINCYIIGLNWMMYGDNNLVYYENKPVLERLDNKNGIPNKHIKSFIRGGLNEVIFADPHSLKGFTNICGANGKSIINGPFNEDLTNFNFGYIKHFYSKTAEEFVRKISKTL